MFLYKYKKKCLPLLKTAVFQDYICSRTIRLGPNSSAQKSKRPHPGTQILSQIPEDGEGNRGQMLHICPGSPPPPPLGLNIDRCITFYNIRVVRNFKLRDLDIRVNLFFKLLLLLLCMYFCVEPTYISSGENKT